MRTDFMYYVREASAIIVEVLCFNDKTFIFFANFTSLYYVTIHILFKIYLLWLQQFRENKIESRTSYISHSKWY